MARAPTTHAQQRSPSHAIHPIPTWWLGSNGASPRIAPLRMAMYTARRWCTDCVEGIVMGGADVVNYFGVVPATEVTQVRNCIFMRM